jgi:hypothetical protein
MALYGFPCSEKTVTIPFSQMKANRPQEIAPRHQILTVPLACAHRAERLHSETQPVLRIPVLQFLYIIAAVVVVAGGRRFFQVNSKQQALTLGAAWVFPGAGHLMLGQRKRAFFLGGIVLSLFLIGLALGGFRNISPFDRHPIWGLAHLFGGGMSGIAAAATHGLTLDSEVPNYSVGCLYSAAACLLNILLMVDVFDILHKKSPEDPS